MESFLERIGRIIEEIGLPQAERAKLLAACELDDQQTLLDPGQALPRAETMQLRGGDSSDTTGAEGRSRVVSSDLPGASEEKYRELQRIGSGGMGEVWRVWDRDLDRTVVKKVVRPGLSEEAVRRFLTEARVTARLQHPGILPVHELALMPDGRPFYTMREVCGRTLKEVIQEVHTASSGAAWRPGPSGWSLRRLVESFQRACEAVGYAHSVRVIHRDIKPDNVMLGPFGEVLIADWGLAKLLDPEEGTESTLPGLGPLRGTPGTRQGAVLGTPAYMPPEQALGDLERLGPQSDVYALGAVLYHILAGAPPFTGRSAPVLAQVVVGSFPPPSEAGRGGQVPRGLEAVCLKAMSRDSRHRHHNAAELAEEIGAWLDGAQRRERALEYVLRARVVRGEAVALRESAGSARIEADSLLDRIRPHDPDELKQPGWLKQDQAAELEQQASLKDLEYAQALRSSLNHLPELPEAHALLAAYYLDKHRKAEAARDDLEAARCEILLRDHDRGHHAGYLKGDGALSLVTHPPGAEVQLSRYVSKGRRLVAEPVEALGRTPLNAVTLPMGSYLMTITARGRAKVQYPVLIEREQVWNGASPGESDPFPVYLPAADELGPEDVYVPAGWFWSGGDPGAPESLARRKLWTDAFIMKRVPVTNRVFVAFLDDLVADGKEEQALAFAPRERSGGAGEPGPVIYGRDRRGRFVLTSDSEGREWEPDWPVMMVDWQAAVAWCRWLSDLTGLSWRLPAELEWEKAARGADGRFFPWGDNLDPSWCCMRDSRGGPAQPASVESFPVDVSPYGIRGLGGGVADWCLEQYQERGPATPSGRVIRSSADDPATYRVFRGGSWLSAGISCRAANRDKATATALSRAVGFRPMRSL